LRKTVLVAEDEFLILEYLADILSEAGFDVIRTFNADEAIEVLETRADIFAILTDIDMPGSMDGLKLAASVRDRWPPIHVIVTTGKNIGRDIPSGAHFLPKPFGPDNLLELVARLH
jgi:CheY-like chemotaxis protein